LNNVNTSPPKFAQWMLKRFLRDDLAEEVEGDLEEKFFEVAKRKSVFRANLNYWYQAFHYLRPFAMRKKKSTTINYDMYQNYFKISWRSLVKQKMYSFIKIGGLALGIAACFLIALFVIDELSYDQHHVNGDRIYRVLGVLEGEETSRDVDLPPPAIYLRLRQQHLRQIISK
jgi:putative ABC transport system permease protein